MTSVGLAIFISWNNLKNVSNKYYMVKLVDSQIHQTLFCRHQSSLYNVINSNSTIHCGEITIIITNATKSCSVKCWVKSRVANNRNTMSRAQLHDTEWYRLHNKHREHWLCNYRRSCKFWSSVTAYKLNISTNLQTKYAVDAQLAQEQGLQEYVSWKTEKSLRFWAASLNNWLPRGGGGGGNSLKRWKTWIQDSKISLL
jgi:hypothetical protein